MLLLALFDWTTNRSFVPQRLKWKLKIFFTFVATCKSDIFSDDKFVVVRRDKFDKTRCWTSQIRHYFQSWEKNGKNHNFIKVKHISVEKYNERKQRFHEILESFEYSRWLLKCLTAASISLSSKFSIFSGCFEIEEDFILSCWKEISVQKSQNGFALELLV